jgi:hypothetical protein
MRSRTFISAALVAVLGIACVSSNALAYRGRAGGVGRVGSVGGVGRIGGVGRVGGVGVYGGGYHRGVAVGVVTPRYFNSCGYGRC